MIKFSYVIIDQVWLIFLLFFERKILRKEIEKTQLWTEDYWKGNLKSIV